MIEREAEREQQAVEVVELVEPREHRALDDDAGRADDDRRDERATTSSRCPSLFSRNHAQNAPIMYCAPCVKLMMLSRPKITASPSDSIA